MNLEGFHKEAQPALRERDMSLAQNGVAYHVHQRKTRGGVLEGKKRNANDLGEMRQVWKRRNKHLFYCKARWHGNGEPRSLD